MTVTPRLSGRSIAAAIILGALAGLIWLVQIATLSDLTGSDPAGNGLAQAFAAAEIVVLWLLLAVLVVIAGVAASVPSSLILPGVVLLPMSGIAALAALGLLTEPDTPPFLWPLIVSVAVPPLIVLLCIWALLPPPRATVPGRVVAALVWGGTAALSVSIIPMRHIKQAVAVQQQVARDTWAADFTNLPKDAPLWRWTPFLTTSSDVARGEVLDGIRQLDRRQSDAETMLERGDFPLFYLGRFDLAPSQSICDKARALLRRQLGPLLLQPGETESYAVIREPVAAAVEAMEWLSGHGCPCDGEAQAWEAMANAYSDTEWDVYRLRDIHK